MTLLLAIVRASSSSSSGSLLSFSIGYVSATELGKIGNYGTTPSASNIAPPDNRQRYYNYIGKDYYADDSNVCSGEMDAKVSRFSQATDRADLFAWEYQKRIAVTGGCNMTFNSYADYGIELIFKGGNSYNYINIKNVTLEIFTESTEERNIWVCLCWVV